MPACSHSREQMLLSDAYARAAVPRPYRVLGLTLRPYCLGHALLLELLNSPFTRDDQQPGFNDLVLAVLICANTYETASELIRSTSMPLGVRLWRWQVRCRLSQAGMLDRIRLVAEYIKEGSKAPRVWANPELRHGSSAPRLAILKLNLLIHLRKGESEAFNTPLGLALWESAAFWESQGALELLTQTDDGLLAAAKKMEEPAP